MQVREIYLPMEEFWGGGGFSEEGSLELGQATYTFVGWLMAPRRGFLPTPLACSGLGAPSCVLEIVPNILSRIIMKICIELHSFIHSSATLRIALGQVEGLKTSFVAIMGLRSLSGGETFVCKVCVVGLGVGSRHIAMRHVESRRDLVLSPGSAPVRSWASSFTSLSLSLLI